MHKPHKTNSKKIGNSYLVTRSSEEHGRILRSRRDGGDPATVALQCTSKLKLFSHCLSLPLCWI